MKLGVVGAGKFIPFHLAAATQVGFELEAVVARDYSENAKRIAKEYSFKTCHPTLSSFISSAKYFDAILIGCDISALFTVLSDLSKLNIPILIEKPIFVDRLQLKNLESIANQDKILVGYNRRYYKTIQRIKEIINQNPGARVNFRIPELSGTENHNEDMIRNIVIGNTVHMIDLVQFCLGADALDIRNLNSLVKTPGATTFNVSANGSKTCELMFGYADNYSIEVLINGMRHVVKPLETLTTYAGMEVLPPDELISYRRYLPKPSAEMANTFHENYDLKPGFYGQYNELLNMVHGRRDNIGASFQEAINVSRFALEFLDSFLSRN